MSQNIVDLIGIFVDAMRTTATITSEIDNGDGSITITSNVAALDENDYIILGGNNYRIYDLNTIAGTFKINATFPTGETEWKTAAPYYYHGTPQTVNKEVDTQNETLDKARYPAIILWEVIRQDFDKDPISVVGNTARLTMSFLDTTNKIDWSVEQHYDNVIDKMEDQADRFISICKNHPYINRFDDYSYIKHFNWGTVVQDKGHVKYILDENLSGLNLEVALPIKKNCLNKYARLLPIGVPPLPTTDATYTNSDNSFTRLIAGGDTFTAPDISVTDSDGSVSNQPANTNVICSPSADATYENSDASFVQVISGGTTYTAPDISFTDSDGSVSNVPANTDVVCTPAASGTIYARPTPKFGLSTSYRTYDDAWQYQNGTYTTGYAQSSGTMQTLDATDLNAETLTLDNKYGNKNRFTDGLGGQDWANAVVGDLTDKRWLTEDHLTGLMWHYENIAIATGSTIINSTYTNNLNLAATLNIYGHSDWRIAAMHEINSIPWNGTSTYFKNAYFRQAVFTSLLDSCSMRTTTRYFSRNINGIISGNNQITSTSTRTALFIRTM